MAVVCGNCDWIYSSNFNAQAESIVKSSKLSDLSAVGPILFKGVAHRLTGRNPLAVSVLNGYDSTFSFDSTILNGIVDPNSPFVGSNVALVSALQTRNNARIVFSGSVDMFSDRYHFPLG